MTTTVYLLPHRSGTIPRNALVCHLRSTSPSEAIAKLQSNGILAIEGIEPNSIVLVGFKPEAQILLDNIRQFPYLNSHCTMTRIRAKLAIAKAV